MPGLTASAAAAADWLACACASRLTPRVAIRTVAVIAWAVEIWTCFYYRRPSPLHELWGVSTIVVSVWAIAETFGGRRLRNGERVVGDAELHELEGAITRAVVAGYREGEGSGEAAVPRSIRAVPSR